MTIGKLQDGFSGILIGRDDGTGSISLGGDVGFFDPVFAVARRIDRHPRRPLKESRQCQLHPAESSIKPWLIPNKLPSKQMPYAKHNWPFWKERFIWRAIDWLGLALIQM
jgi:hypothetical protein